MVQYLFSKYRYGEIKLDRFCDVKLGPDWVYSWEIGF